MKVEKKYYICLDIIRVVACLGVLLYHLGYLRGGFLSVCCFFVLSGYLSYISLSRMKKISLLEYYKKRFFHIYLPLLIVVLLSICCISFIPSIHWFQLKPESTSVLLGYNNYWQLSVNADYFARHVSSPFMHFWYLGILLQFELIFPFLYLIINKIKKIRKVFPIVLISLLTLASCVYFVYCSLEKNIMISYYDSLARSFSILMGILIGYIHVEFKPLFFKNYAKAIFYIYLTIFIILQFITESTSSYYYIVMIVVSIITCRLIDYGTIDSPKKLNMWESETKYLAEVSYEVYLFQYPIIFIFQYITLDIAYKMPIMILLIFVLSYFLHYSLDFKNNKKIKIACCVFLSFFSLFGLFKYVSAKDYTVEMNNLKNQLSENQKMIEEKQKDYEMRLKEENDSWNSVLNNLENGEADLKNYVANLPIVAVGDSVMLGAVPTLYQQFPNGYFDAAVSRTDYEANAILQGIKNQSLLADNVVIHLGTNGQCGAPCQKEILSTCSGHNIFYVTVSNDAEVHVNQSFYTLASNNPNVRIIDWYSASMGHGEYFAADGIHLTSVGMNAYTQTIYNGIYQFYHEQYEAKKNKLMKEHEEKINSQIYFYGNDLLLNVYDSLLVDYPESGFSIKQDYTFKGIYNDLSNDIKNKKVPKKIVIAMDQIGNNDINNYKKIIELAKGYELYFVFVYNLPYTFNDNNVHIISYKTNKDSFMVDGIHLSKKGNKELLDTIKKGLNT